MCSLSPRLCPRASRPATSIATPCPSLSRPSACTPAIPGYGPGSWVRLAGATTDNEGGFAIGNLPADHVAVVLESQSATLELLEPFPHAVVTLEPYQVHDVGTLRAEWPVYAHVYAQLPVDRPGATLDLDRIGLYLLEGRPSAEVIDALTNSPYSVSTTWRDHAFLSPRNATHTFRIRKPWGRHTVWIRARTEQWSIEIDAKPGSEHVLDLSRAHETTRPR